LAAQPDKPWLRRINKPQRRLCLLTLQGHIGDVNAFVFSPNGRHLVSAGSDHTLRVWDVPTAREILVLIGHEAPVRFCRFLGDGVRIVSAAIDGTLRIWDLRDGGARFTLPARISEAPKPKVAVSVDGVLVAAPCSEDENALCVWESSTGTEKIRLTGHAGKILACDFSPDGRRLVTASADGTLKVWTLDRGRSVELAGHEGPVITCAFSPDDVRIASGGHDGAVKVWQASNGRLLHNLAGHLGAVHLCVFSPDGRRLASAAVPLPKEGILRTAIEWELEHSALKLWEVAGGKELATLQHRLGGNRQLGCVASFSRDGTRIASACGNVVVLWDAATGAEIAAFPGHSEAVNQCGFSPEEAFVASSSTDGTVRLWDVHATAVGEPFSYPIEALEFSPDGSRILSSTYKIFMLWDGSSGAKVGQTRGESWTYAPEGSLLVSTGRALDRCDPATGERVATLFKLPRYGCVGCIVSPHGARLVTLGLGSEETKLWDTETWTEIASVPTGRGFPTPAIARSSRIGGSRNPTPCGTPMPRGPTPCARTSSGSRPT